MKLEDLKPQSEGVIAMLNHLLTEEEDDKIAHDAWGEDQFAREPWETYKRPDQVGKPLIEIATCVEDLNLAIWICFEQDIQFELKQ